MRKLIVSTLLLAAIALLACPVVAQTTSTASVESKSFRLIFLGTRYYNDVYSIIASLRELPQITSLTPSLESQSRLEFVGFFTGSQHSLNADVASLAADRFMMEELKGDDSKIVVTLKKLGPPSTVPAF